MAHTNLLSEQKSVETAGMIQRSEDHLKNHAALSYSEAHGAVPCKISSYQDSVGQAVASYVLEFSANEETVYVPAKLLEGGSVDNSNPNGVSFIPPKLDKAFPSGSHLVTGNETFDNLKPEIDLDAEKIRAHALQKYHETHGGIKFKPQDTFDENGHCVGRKIVEIKVGDETLRLVGDQSITGPPQPPRGQTISRTHVKSYADEGEGPPPFEVVTAQIAGGTMPVYWQWQWSTNLVEWFDFTKTMVKKRSSGGHFDFGPDPAREPQGQGYSTSYQPDPNHHEEGTESAAFFYRCVFSNEQIGGGKVYTPYVTASMQDKTGSWICGEVAKVHKFDNVELQAIEDFKQYCIQKHPREAALYLRKCRHLIDQMNAQRANWEHFVGFVQAVACLSACDCQETAYQLYLGTMRHLVGQYWPDCPYVGKF